MYNTDYNGHRRKVQHKNPKILSPTKTISSNSVILNYEHRNAVLAVVLVIIALLQMDPANAQFRQPSSGYGTLALENGKHPSDVVSIQNQIKTIIGDQHMQMMVDQSFKNSGKQIQNADYLFPLATGAQIRGWRIQIGQTVTCSHSASFDCRVVQARTVSTTRHFPKTEPLNVIVDTNCNQLHIPINAINANEVFRIQLDIYFPVKNTDHSAPALLPFTDDFQEELADSVSEVVQSMHSLTPIYPIGAMLPL